MPLKHIDLGSNHSCIIRPLNLKLVCWGLNNKGQVEVATEFKLGTLSVGAGAEHTCAVSHIGRTVCFGQGYGNGNAQADTAQSSSSYSSSPDSQPPTYTYTVPAALLSGANSVSSGLFHSCGLGNINDLHCWGLNSAGETDVPEGMDAGVATASAGTTFTCAVSGFTQELHCWGSDSKGQLGNLGMFAGMFRTGVREVSAGAEHACALGMMNEVDCWGEAGLWGKTRLNKGDQKEAQRSVSVGSEHSCAVDSRGGLVCWGALQGGAKMVDLRDLADYVQWQEGGEDEELRIGVREVGSGWSHLCQMKIRGEVKCVGLNNSGQCDTTLINDRRLN